MATSKPLKPVKVVRNRPFRRAFWRGLAIVLPPLMTVVIFLWIGGTLRQYVLAPVTAMTRDVVTSYVADVRSQLPNAEPTQDPRIFISDGREFIRLDDNRYIPLEVYDQVSSQNGKEPMPQSGQAVYARWVEIHYLKPWIVVPLFLVFFILAMYLLGRFLAAGIGRVFWNLLERGIQQVPLVSSVYTSVKQVTDFMFSEGDVQSTRIVAVEYPRPDIWSIGFVTGEALVDVQKNITEPMVSVLIPCSPMPITGYTVMVPKRLTIDLDITFDQACQYYISCGVVLPASQMNAAFNSSSLQLPDVRAGDTSKRQALSSQ